ncbi:MAG: zinc-ribbon domain-containing protein [Methanomicrobiales archaeon]
MVYCSNCGKKNKDNSKYCYNCGKPIILEKPEEKPYKPLKEKILQEEVREQPDGSSEPSYEYDAVEKSEKELWGIEWKVVAMGTILLLIFYAIMLRLIPSIAFIIGAIIAAFYVFSATKKGYMFLIEFPMVLIFSLIITTLFSF